MRIVYAAPGEKAVVRDVENDLSALQTLVGGYLEKLPFLPSTKPLDPTAFDFIVPDGGERWALGRRARGQSLAAEDMRVLDAQRSGEFDLIINDCGLLEGLPPNRLINEEFAIVGPLFITKANDEGDWVSLTEHEAAMLADMLNSESDVCRTLKTEEVYDPSDAGESLAVNTEDP
jgi:hypothetical protein